MKNRTHNKTTGNASFSVNFFVRLLDKHISTYHRFVGKKSVDACYSALSEEIESNNNKTPRSNVVGRVKINKYKSIFSKG